MNPAVMERAAEWFVALRDDEAARDAFDAWLAEHPDHARAFAQVETAWAGMAAASHEPEIVTSRHRALGLIRAKARARWTFSGRRRGALAAAVAALLLVPALAWFQLRSGPEQTFETAAGETRLITLADGSRVALDGRSRVEVDYTAQARLVKLTGGQAQFEVAKDAARPFRVTAGDRTIVAVGTAFNVEVLADKVLVTLLEGRVTVSEAASVTAPAQHLMPGEQLVAKANAPAPVKQAVNIDNAMAWRGGTLVFNDEPLSAAVARINRHARHALIVADPKVADIGISGVFDARDTDAFVDVLEYYFRVRVLRDADGSIRLLAPS